MGKSAKPKRPPARLGVAFDVCGAAVGVACAEKVTYKTKVLKVGGKRMCRCGLVETLHGEIRHEFQPEMVTVATHALIDKRCRTARSAKARLARQSELAEQREMFDGDAVDFKDAFPGAAS